MSNEELTDRQLEEDRMDQVEEDRLRPIYEAQREVLDGFCKWLNDRHPNGAQFVVKPNGTIIDDFKPYLDIVSDTLECKGESDEIDLNGNDPWLVLHNIYSLELAQK